MYPTRASQGNGPSAKPLRTSDRLRSRRNIYARSYLYFSPRHSTRGKTRRTDASQIAKMLRPDNRPAATTNLRRSTRKRRPSVNLEVYTDSSGTDDDDLMRPMHGSSRNRADYSASEDESLPLKHEKSSNAKSMPRREGLRPRHGKTIPREYTILESDDETADKVYQDRDENGNDTEANDIEDGEDVADAEEEDDADEEDEDDDEGQDGKRRYDLRNRSDVRRASFDINRQRSGSPRRVLQQGTGSKVTRDMRKGGSRPHKRTHLTRVEDSDDSLLVDELDQGHAIPWSRAGNKSGPSWLFGGLDMHGATSWGLNVAASGWGHQSDAFAAMTSGFQTAGPSSKGGADIQPLQIDETVSFDDIGGLSEYIDALKEMVFFPLLYPDFFASYNITPPRGVLLCGPPGTGKTLIARALACAASKAGQKVSFYMRKGADVLSKWVGEAERQLKLLFDEAQRNQPSIIFFDEIDGLAPVRSSKQEQIHNSIVSTLLALMDGLDSRGQVVLIGATNRVDAIDGALRRPGRFDREFNFPLPGFDARAEIIDIHTRKWKQSPSEELKLELAASCVGYCGADLKALCTEAAIRAFREKYPQVYASDDKFLIDVDSVKVEKCHFVEAMATITPAAHRGFVVPSRPLSPVIAPCLQRHLQNAMKYLKDIFPFFSASSELAKISLLSCGSAIPLVYRPRFLLYSDDGVGLDHLGPAVLHELEKFPVHSMGFPTLLSDPSAKTPEEALVHIFREARRTSPSILYLPQLHLWWENAYQQLKAVFITLLEDMPSDLPVLLLGTSSLTFSEMDELSSSVFPQRSVYEVDKPSIEDRVSFFEQLIKSSLALPCENMRNSPRKQASISELSKAPKATSGPKLSELKSKVEAEQHALRRLRMCLRDVCNRILYDKRFSAFHYPVIDEDAPNYRSVISNPMDAATMLQNVDCGQYITCKDFLHDVDLIVDNAKVYNGNDYNGARIVSRACELRDAVHGMLAQIDPSLTVFCEKIESQGGPTQMPNGVDGSTVPSSAVTTVTRTSARLRNVHPEVSLSQSIDAMRRPRKFLDATRADEEKLHNRETRSRASPETDANNASCMGQAEGHNNVDGDAEGSGSEDEDVAMEDAIFSHVATGVKQLLVEKTEGYNIPQLERLYTRIIRGAFETKQNGRYSKSSILKFLVEFAEDPANF